MSIQNTQFDRGLPRQKGNTSTIDAPVNLVERELEADLRAIPLVMLEKTGQTDWPWTVQKQQ